MADISKFTDADIRLQDAAWRRLEAAKFLATAAAAKRDAEDQHAKASADYREACTQYAELEAQIANGIRPRGAKVAA
jgi:hypothetical protein